MARITSDQKKDIINKIRDHILVEGPRNWDDLMGKHPNVSRATFWRLIKEARERMEDTAGDSADSIRMVQRRIRARVEPADQVTEKIKAHLPVAPSPAVVAAAPQDVISAFNFFAFFDKIVQDVELSRASAMTKNEDGTERVKNPMLFDRNIARRLSIIETYLHSVETVWNMDRIRELYELIVEEVGKADPEVQQAVLARLRTLNNKRGITMAARP